MIPLNAVVYFVLYVLVAAAVFGILYYAVSRVEAEFPSSALFCKVARIFLVVAGAFVLIGIITGVFSGHPLFVR